MNAVERWGAEYLRGTWVVPRMRLAIAMGWALRSLDEEIVRQRVPVILDASGERYIAVEVCEEILASLSEQGERMRAARVWAERRDPLALAIDEMRPRSPENPLEQLRNTIDPANLPKRGRDA